MAKPPGVPTAMRLEITCIKPYDRNPRRSENPEYDRIKTSIQADGMDQPLVVTDDDVAGTFTFIRALEDYGS